jgi:putative endonuclease
MFYVYILASRKHGTLYIGVTRGLARRLHSHRNGTGSEFVLQHGVFRLVWAYPFATAVEAIAYEKRLKRWRRSWKVQLIEARATRVQSDADSCSKL